MNIYEPVTQYKTQNNTKIIETNCGLLPDPIFGLLLGGNLDPEFAPLLYYFLKIEL